MRSNGENNQTAVEYGEHWDKVAEALSTFPEVVDRIVAKHTQPELSAPFYDSRAIALPAGETVELFGYDASRIRFYVRALTENNVQIGSRDTLTADQGWVLTNGSPTEFHTVDRLFVKATAATTIYLWVEYRKS